MIHSLGQWHFCTPADLTPGWMIPTRSRSMWMLVPLRYPTVKSFCLYVNVFGAEAGAVIHVYSGGGSVDQEGVEELAVSAVGAVEMGARAGQAGCNFC